MLSHYYNIVIFLHCYILISSIVPASPFFVLRPPHIRVSGLRVPWILRLPSTCKAQKVASELAPGCKSVGLVLSSSRVL